ncbi:MAG: metalloregulator ArsR/SmtB family transcription factor [Cyanobacteria bacterium J06656_5]
MKTTALETTASTDILPIFQAFAESYRLQVIELLRDRELCACDIANHLEISASKLSFHLKTLREAGLIQGRQEGRWIYYRLNLSQFVVLEQYLSEFRRLSPILPARNCPD